MFEHGIETNDPNGYDRPNAFTSRPCDEVAEFIESLGFEVERNVRRLISPLELDIFVPEKSFAVEFNGLFYHSFKPESDIWSDRKGPDYHLTKTMRAQEVGIRLFHVFEDSWTFKTEIVKSMIRSMLGVSRRVYARNCEIVEVSKTERKTFFDLNHIQGDSPAKNALGLRLDGDLVACMTFGKSRFNKHYDWELIRFASSDLTVVGGFSKLLKAFRVKNPGSIISYADRSHSQGGVYAKNGFELTGETKGNFWYLDPSCKKRLHRSAFVKGRIAPGDLRSGNEIMRDRGYRQIFGCGTQSWVLP